MAVFFNRKTCTCNVWYKLNYFKINLYKSNVFVLQYFSREKQFPRSVISQTSQKYKKQRMNILTEIKINWAIEIIRMPNHYDSIIYDVSNYAL